MLSPPRPTATAGYRDLWLRLPWAPSYGVLLRPGEASCVTPHSRTPFPTPFPEAACRLYRTWPLLQRLLLGRVPLARTRPLPAPPLNVGRWPEAT